MVFVGPIPEKRPKLNPFRKTTPRLPLPQSTVVIKVSVGSLAMVKVAFVKVGVEIDGAGELFQLFKLNQHALKSKSFNRK